MRIVFAAAAALAPLSAMAADLPVRAPAPVIVAPLFTWSGFYFGLNAGASFRGSDTATTIGTNAFLAFPPVFAPRSLQVGETGFVGGAQAGYNWQAGALVFGVEADIQLADGGKRASFVGADLGGGFAGLTLTTTARASLDYFGTLRARLGFTPVDRMLIYATGGLAYGQAKLSNSVIVPQAPAVSWAGSASSTKMGWALGAGMEFAVTNNVTLKAEYLHVNLGHVTSYAAGNAAVRAIPALDGVDYVARKAMRSDIARVGFNYKY
jgi:outer membrane immunogenic protein